MNKPANAARKGSHRAHGATILPLVIAWVAISAVLVFLLSGCDNPQPGASRDDSEPPMATHTETPSLTPLPTSTEQPIATPTLTATATATSTPVPTPTATATATQAPTHTPTATPTATATETATPPPPTPTPHAIVSGDGVPLRAGPMRKYDILGSVEQGDALPVVGRTNNGKWIQVSYDGQLAWVQAELLETMDAADQVLVVKAKDFPPTPTPRPTRVRPTRAPKEEQAPARIPKPRLIEPRGGAKFDQKSQVRFKFSWVRRLEEGERVSLYIWSVAGSEELNWGVSEADILNGGGAIHEQDDLVVYEINSGFGSLPKGSAYWSVAVYLDTPAEKREVSPRSRGRRIVLK